jgi:hypothetical protein
MLICFVLSLAFAIPMGAMQTRQAEATPVFNDTSKQISVKPSAIIWDSENDHYAVKIKWEQSALDAGDTQISITGVSPIDFSYACLHWTISDNDPPAEPQQFKVGYRSRISGDQWNEWFKTNKIVYVDHLERYVAPFYLAVWGEAHQEFEISLTLPSGVSVETLGLRLANRRGVTEVSGLQEELDLRNQEDAAIQSLPGRPAIIPRSGWWGNLPPGDLNSPGWPPIYRNITHTIIHHTGEHAHNDQPTTAAAAEWVRSIWEWHAEDQGWGDIGYNSSSAPFETNGMN